MNRCGNSKQSFVQCQEYINNIFIFICLFIIYALTVRYIISIKHLIWVFYTRNMTINSGNYINVVGTQQVAIAASAAVSDAINTYGTTPVAISIPSGWTTSDITFSVLPAIGSTYSNDIVTTAGVYKLTGVAANDYICLEPAIFASINTFKIKTSVAQASGVTLLVQFAPILNVANF